MIFLVRHGEAAAAWGDHPDPGLSELGHQQAEQTARALMTLGATRAIKSPLQRCQETALPFEELTDELAKIDPRIGEIQTPPGIEDRPMWLRDIMAGTWEDAEAEQLDWRRQTRLALDDLEDGTVVFSHFVAINAIVGQLMDRANVVIFKPAHCSITQIKRTESGFVVHELGSEAPPNVL